MGGTRLPDPGSHSHHSPGEVPESQAGFDMGKHLTGDCGVHMKGGEQRESPPALVLAPGAGLGKLDFSSKEVGSVRLFQVSFRSVSPLCFPTAERGTGLAVGSSFGAELGTKMPPPQLEAPRSEPGFSSEGHCPASYISKGNITLASAIWGQSPAPSSCRALQPPNGQLDTNPSLHTGPQPHRSGCHLG